MKNYNFNGGRKNLEPLVFGPRSVDIAKTPNSLVLDISTMSNPPVLDISTMFNLSVLDMMQIKFFSLI